MSQTGYTAWAVTAGEQPTTAYWNILGQNDASFNSGSGFNDGVIISRHLATGIQVASVEQNPVKFHYTLANGSITGSSNEQLLIMDTAVYDTGNNYNTSTGWFTAPYAGFYIFGGSVQYMSIASGSTVLTGLFTQISGSTTEFKRFQETDASPGNNYTQSGAVEVMLTAGQKVGLYQWGPSGKTIGPYTNATYFWGSLRSVL